MERFKLIDSTTPKNNIQHGGETMSIDEKKQEIKEMAEVLNGLERDELMQTFGFAMGLKAKREAQAENTPQ